MTVKPTPSGGSQAVSAVIRALGTDFGALGSTSLSCFVQVNGGGEGRPVESAVLSFSGNDLVVQGLKDGILVGTGDSGSLQETGPGTDTHYTATYPSFASDPSEPPASIVTSP